MGLLPDNYNGFTPVAIFTLRILLPTLFFVCNLTQQPELQRIRFDLDAFQTRNIVVAFCFLPDLFKTIGIAVSETLRKGLSIQGLHYAGFRIFNCVYNRNQLFI